MSERWDPRTGVSKFQGKYEWAMGTLFLFTLSVSFFLPPSPISAPLVYAPVVLLSFSWIYTRLWTKKKIARRLRKHDGFLCVWCNYPLTGLPDEGVCPECGAQYKRELCKRLYDLAYGSYKPSPQEFGKRQSTAWKEAIRLRDQES